MSPLQQARIESEWKKFTSVNFVTPSNCRNIDQIRFYVSELCQKIEEYERQFNYVPNWAYVLLAQYNNAQNILIYQDFKESYSSIQ